MKSNIDKKYITHDREPFFEVLRKYIKNDSRILDVGAGHAHFARFLGRNEIYMIDSNITTIEVLKHQFPNIRYSQLPNIPYPDNFFDIIHCSHVVEHLSPEQLYKTILEFNRILKTKGLIAISAPLIWEGFYDDLSHIRPYPPEVFYNYMCANNQISRTRDILDGNYEKVEEIYRWKRKTLMQDIHSNHIMVRPFEKIIRGVTNILFSKMEKTGYTIILKKIA